jgi:hypothetical protein
MGVCEKKPGGLMICRCLYREHRNQKTCVSFIQDHCERGGIVWSDGWMAYQCLPKFGFGHEWLNHSVELMRKDGVNTQRMESLWRVPKKWMNDHGYLSVRWQQEYIDEFCFRHNHGMGNWEAVWQIPFKP